MTLSVQAQTSCYNRFLEKCEDATCCSSKNLNNAVIINYRVDNVLVKEYYDAKDKKQPIGIETDLSKVDVKNLRFVKKNKKLRQLLKKTKLNLALASFFDRPRKGLSQEEVENIFGRPDNINYSIDGADQITIYTYSLKYDIVFRDGVLESYTIIETR